jgi:hypothetical protein
MPVWRLIPVDLTDPSWEASSHRGAAVVRAPDEMSARDLAEAAFGTRSRFAPGKGMRMPPWTRPELVRVVVAEQSTYPADGPSEVLEPSFDRNLRPHPPAKEPKAEKRRGRAGQPRR